MEFLFLFLYRSLSGAQNGLGYAKNRLMIVATSVMVLFMASGVVFASIEKTEGWFPWFIISISFFIAAGLAAIMVHLSFIHTEKWFDIHLWESITTGLATIAVAFVGGDIILILCSVYPALIIHKGFVNMGGGLSFLDNRTDDATGKTFSIPLLGIKVPRLSTYIRFLLAAFSIMGVVIVYALDFNLVLFK